VAFSARIVDEDFLGMNDAAGVPAELLGKSGSAASDSTIAPVPGNGATIAPGCKQPRSAGCAQTATPQELSADAIL
jgi:hypothetical protein